MPGFMLMTLKIDTKSEGKLTYASKNDLKNLANSYRSIIKSQSWDTDRMIFSKAENVWA